MTSPRAVLWGGRSYGPPRQNFGRVLPDTRQETARQIVYEVSPVSGQFQHIRLVALQAAGLFFVGFQVQSGFPLPRRRDANKLAQFDQGEVDVEAVLFETVGSVLVSHCGTVPGFQGCRNTNLSIQCATFFQFLQPLSQLCGDAG